MKEKIKILATVSIYHAINDGTISVISILFPIFILIFNLTYTQIGLITGGSLFISLIMQIIIGRISDGKNCRTTLSIGILLISISLLLITQTSGFITLLISIFLLRFSTSFFHPIGVGWISRIFKKDNLDWAMGIHSGFADIGAFFALATTLLVSELTTWTFPLYIWSISTAIIVISGIIITRGLGEDYLYVNKTKKQKFLEESMVGAFVLLKKIKILIPAFFISGGAWGVIITYLPLLLFERTDLSLSSIGFIVSTWIGIGSITSFLYGKINSIFGRRKIIILAYILMGIMGLLISIVTNFGLLILIISLLGVAVFITYPALASYVSEITDEAIEGKTFGIIFTLQLGGGTILSTIGGIFGDLFGIHSSFLLLGLLSIILSILLQYYYREL